MSTFKILSAPPLLTVQDSGREGALAFGLCASGPMDDVAFVALSEVLLGAATSGLEFAAGKLELEVVDGQSAFAWAGAGYVCHLNNQAVQPNMPYTLAEGDNIAFVPSGDGNFAYLRFKQDIEVPLVLGSRATNLVARIGGFEGRNLRAGDQFHLVPSGQSSASPSRTRPFGMGRVCATSEPFKFVWGLHQNLFENGIRQAFCEQNFKVSNAINRMGFRLVDEAQVFADFKQLSLVSDPVVAGDIQILGDGTPIVLMRDHQPTGGYPRIGTLLQSEISRFAQMPPGATVRFEPINVERAQQELRSRA